MGCQLRIIISLLFTLVLSAQLSASIPEVDARRASYNGARPKYIFIFIGDGFGMTQAEAAETFTAAQEGRVGITALTMNKLPVYGMMTTFASNHLITDSAAAGTALATGIKTSPNRIGMDEDAKEPLHTVAERAHALGIRVGIVTSVPVDHATPATFYAHQPDRNMFYEIALDLSASGFDYFAGSGFTSPEGDATIEPGDKSRNIGLGKAQEVHSAQNCKDIARACGYNIVETRADFEKLAPGAGKTIVATTGQGGSTSGLAYAIDRIPGDMTLEEFTRKGIALLDGPTGFFMMVEGGKIDWACHANDAATTVREVLDMDMAVRAAIDFANDHPGEVLIIVTSDHETGGMGLGYAGTRYESRIELLANQKVSYEAFTKVVDAYRKAHPDGGTVADGLALAKEYFGLGDAAKGLALKPIEDTALRAAFRDSMLQSASGKETDRDARYLSYGDYDPLSVTCCHILNNKAGIGWTSYAHTASPVPVRTLGPGKELFSGYMDNTDIAKNIFCLLAMKLPAAKATPQNAIMAGAR
jgi:alkaline phosphatase